MSPSQKRNSKRELANKRRKREEAKMAKYYTRDE